MPKSTNSTNNFTSGEWSPRARGRFDLDKYKSGAGKIENFLINQLGGVSYRPGSRYVAETKDSGVARIFPFQYSSDQDYVVEAGDSYMRFYENDADSVGSTYDPYTKLLMHMNGIDGSYEVQDTGNTGHVVTQVGTATLSTTEKKMGLASLSLDGDSDTLTMDDHADWDLVASALDTWTVDFWVKHDDHVGIEGYIGQFEADNKFWQIYNSHGVGLRFSVWDAGDVFTLTGAEIADKGWHHIAVIKIADEYGLYKDGAQIAYAQDATTKSWAGGLRIGSYAAASNWFDGYIDEVRIIKSNPFTGAPVVGLTDTITVPTAAHTSDANTKLLLHMESLDTSSVTTPKIPDFIGTAQLDTAQYKDLTGNTLGKASLLLDGGSDWVQYPDSDDFNFGTGDFTIDVQVRFAGIGAQQNICGQYEDANNYWFFEITAANKLQIKFVDGAGTKGDYITTAAVPGIAINTWFHFEVVRSGVIAYAFVNGTLAALTETTAFSTNDVGDMAEDLKIGAYGADAGEGRFFNGWMDEFRISKGIARNTASFTAPTAQYALSAIFILGDVTSPYAVADVFELQMAQNNDVMYIVHPDYAPYKLSRTGATTFTLAKVAFVRGPLLDTNITTTTITPSADAGAGITITGSAAIFDYDATLAAGAQSQVGSFWRIKSGMVKILTVTSNLAATADVEAEPDGTAGGLATGPGAVTDWAEGAFSDYRGWPSAIAFHEQRLYYANTEYEPQKGWASYIAAYDSFDTTAVTDDYSITFEVATEQRNAIKWLSSGNRSLTLGTIGGTFSASSSNTLESIAPDNIVINRDTNYGVAALPPKRISSFLYYLQRDYSRLRELSYSFQVDATVSSDMNLFAEHILKDSDSVVDLDHQQSPNDRIFCVREDGQLAILTRNPEQEVMGWGRFIAGTDSQGVGVYESVAVIPKSEEDDQVWVVVKRYVDGATVRYIEYFTSEDFEEDWDAVRVDSSLTLDSPDTITGVTIATDLILYTAGSVALSDGDQIKINGVVGTTDINGTFLVDTLTLGVSFKIKTLAGAAIDFAAYDAWISGGEIRKMVTAIAGLTHLEGATVSVQVDGGLPSTETYVVAGGAITLSAKAAVVHAGLPYTGTLQLLKLSDGSATGTGQTRTRRIFHGTLRLDRTQGLSIGRTTTTLDDLSYSDETSATDLFTGDMEKVFQTTWDNADEIIIKQSTPQPANILAVILRSQVEEG